MWNAQACVPACAQLTQKAKTLSFKALDQTLQTQDRVTNRKEATSYRCADMDRMVPQFMGVSKARFNLCSACM